MIDFKLSKLKLSDLTLSELKASDFKNIDRGSLKLGIIKAIILGTLLAVAVYGIINGVSDFVLKNFYATDRMRRVREERLIDEFREYVDENEISSDDKDAISHFADQRTYIYLLIYKGDEFYFSSGMYDDAALISIFSNLFLGGTVDHPTEEEMMEYAHKNGLVKIEMADAPVYVSITDFSEYLYMDIFRILTISLALLALATVITSYFFRVISRITRLAADVNVVADGDMSHEIYSDGNDEISKLSHDVDNMRNTIVQTLESEREARAANTELITSMSHDIRTPLTVLIGYLDIMKTYSKDEQMDEYIKRSEKTAMRLKKLSDDMFKYFLVFGDSAQPSALEEYDGEMLVDQLLAEHILLLREQGYDIRFSGNDGQRSRVLTSAPDLMRIIDNIFSNIRKYADKSTPVCISVTATDGRLKMNFSNRVARDMTVAESTGIGLKTCAKIADLISCEFSYAKSEYGFAATVGLLIKGDDDSDTLL